MVCDRFGARGDLMVLDEEIIFDCLGLGAGAVFGDTALGAIKGPAIPAAVSCLHLPLLVEENSSSRKCARVATG